MNMCRIQNVCPRSETRQKVLCMELCTDKHRFTFDSPILIGAAIPPGQQKVSETKLTAAEESVPKDLANTRANPWNNNARLPESIGRKSRHLAGYGQLPIRKRTAKHSPALPKTSWYTIWSLRSYATSRNPTIHTAANSAILCSLRTSCSAVATDFPN